MSDIETKAGEGSELAELSEKCSELERRSTMLQVALVLVALSLAFFVEVQVRRAGRDLEGIRPQLASFAEANKKQDPLIQTLAQKLVDFGRSHPDFTPVVLKYGLNTNTALLNPTTAK